MEDKNFKERISDHWNKHRIKYFVAGGIVVCTSVAAIVGYKLGYKAAPNQIGNIGGDVTNGAVNLGEVGGDFENAPRIVLMQTITAGHPGDLIEDPLTGEKWFSQRQAMDALDVTRGVLKKMVNSGELINHGANTGVALA